MSPLATKTIGLLAQPASVPFIDILRGIRHFTGPSRRWRVLARSPGEPESLKWLMQQKLDGQIAHVSVQSHLDACLELGVPMVSTSGRFSPQQLAGKPITTIRIDEQAVGAMAARHLMSLGLVNFALFGIAWLHYSRERYAGFCKALSERGYCCQTFWGDREDSTDPDSPPAAEPPEDVLGEFLTSLPKPCGLLATDPGYADRMIDLAMMMKILVPEELAVVSAHDSDIAAHCSLPPISAVRLPLEQLGYRAGEALDRLMAGRKPPHYKPLQPLRIEQRGSTAMLATTDPQVRSAMAYIRRNCLTPCSVEDVLDAVGCSRSYLDRAFRKALGCTVFGEIRRRQILAAKQLLSSTELTVESIAITCGFSGGMRFSQVFRQCVGQSPSAYRRQFGKKSVE